MVNQTKIYFFKVNNRDTRKRCQICSKLAIKTPERRHRCRFGVFLVNFEYISHLFLVFLLLNLSKSTKSPEDVICAQNIWFQLSKKVLRNIYSKLSFWNFEQLFLDVSIAFFHQNHRTNYYFFMKEAEIFFSWVYILFRFNVCVKSNSSCKIKKKSTKQVKK